jgi:hypothetical protein
MCLLFHYRSEGARGGMLEGLFTPLSVRTIQGLVSILDNSLARQELLVRTRSKQKEREFYFLLEHLGEICGSHPELRVVWED